MVTTIKFIIIFCIIIGGCNDKEYNVPDNFEPTTPVLYERGAEKFFKDFTPLTRESQYYIQSIAENLENTNGRLWFILGVDPQYNAVIYYLPDMKQSQIWKGKMILLSYNESSKKWEPGELMDYFYIPDVDNEMAIPDVTNLPFIVMGEIDTYEIVSITVFSKSVLKVEDGPIISISLEDYEKIEVRTAARRVPMGGTGAILYLKKNNKDNRWKLVKKGRWIS